MGFGLCAFSAANRTRTCTVSQWDLNPSCLPIPPQPQIQNNYKKSPNALQHQNLIAMRVAGLEPARYRYRGILSPLCLPIPPHPQKPRRNFSTRATAENQDLYAPCTDVLKLYFNGTLVGEGGFEPPKLLAADLQSVPFGHSGIHPYSI